MAVSQFSRLIQQKHWESAIGGTTSKAGWNNDMIKEKYPIYEKLGVAELRKLYQSIAVAWVTGNTGTLKARDFVEAGIINMHWEGTHMMVLEPVEGAGNILKFLETLEAKGENLQTTVVDWGGYQSKASPSLIPLSTVMPGQSIPEVGSSPSLAQQSTSSPPTLAKTTTKPVVEKWLNWVKDQTDQHSIDQLSQLIGYGCLIMARACVKNEGQLINAFNEKVKQNFSRLFPDHTFKDGPILPHKEFLNDCIAQFSKGSANVTRVFKVLVRTHLERDDKSIKGILQSGCLLHTAGNGLGLVNMLDGVAKQLGQQIPTVMDACCTATTLKALTSLAKFLDDVRTPPNVHNSWYWCRIIDDDYYRDLNVASCPALAAMFAGVLQNETEGGLWDMVGMNQIPETTKKVNLQHGQKIVEYYNQMGLSDHTSLFGQIASTNLSKPKRSAPALQLK